MSLSGTLGSIRDGPTQKDRGCCRVNSQCMSTHVNRLTIVLSGVGSYLCNALMCFANFLMYWCVKIHNCWKTMYTCMKCTQKCVKPAKEEFHACLVTGQLGKKDLCRTYLKTKCIVYGFGLKRNPPVPADPRSGILLRKLKIWFKYTVHYRVVGLCPQAFVQFKASLNMNDCVI